MFGEIAVRCDGMLAPAIYQALYESAKAGGIIVEVGTALGAATTSLALGLQASGLPGRVYSFDPMTGGPRRNLTGVDLRIERTRANLHSFGVDHLVDLVPTSLPDGIGRLPADEPVSVLLLDADGRIDRDLLAIFHRIAPGGVIIIDDDADRVRLNRVGLASYKVDSKMRLTHLLTADLKRQGAITPTSKIKDTLFTRKSEKTVTLDPLQLLEVYRELVFQEANYSPLSWAKGRLIAGATRFTPESLQRARVIYRKMAYKALGGRSSPTVTGGTAGHYS